MFPEQTIIFVAGSKMKKYVLSWLVFLIPSLQAQLSPLQRFQDIYAITSVIVSDGRIIAATDKEKLLTSTDGGINWEEITGNIPPGINKLAKAGISLIFGCGDNGKVIRSTDNGLSWVELATNTSSNLLSITSINSYTLLACGKSGTIIKTTNRGDSWSVSTNGNYDLNDIKFSSHLTGWVAGENGVVLKSTDGGSSWVRVAGAGASCDFAVISLYSDAGVAIFGREGQVVASTNSGNSWIYGYDNSYMTGDTVIGAWHYNNDTILYADDRGAILMCFIKSGAIKFGRYGGESPNHARYLSAFKTDDKWFYVAGVGPNLARAYGSSNSWKQLLALTKGTELWNLRFADSNVGIVCGKIPGVSFWAQGYVYVTTDGGLNWRLSADVRQLEDVQTVSPRKLLKIDYTLWFSGDTGKTWQRSSAPSDLFDVIFTDSINGYMTSYVDFPAPNGVRTRLFRTSNGGQTWTLLMESNYYYFTEMLAGPGGIVWLRARDCAALMTSNDGGLSFPVTNYLGQGYVAGGLADQRGYIAFSTGTISFTTNAGNYWTTTYNSSGTILNGGSNSINGQSLVVGNNGTMLATTNSGETWHELNSGVSYDLSSVALLPDLSFIVGTTNGEFYKGAPPGIFTHVNAEPPVVPDEFTIANYPNPFNGTTVIFFTLRDAVTCLLEVFTSTGSKVLATPVTGMKGPNKFEFNAGGIGSGVFYYRLQAGEKTLTSKMIHLK